MVDVGDTSSQFLKIEISVGYWDFLFTLTNERLGAAFGESMLFLGNNSVARIPTTWIPQWARNLYAFMLGAPSSRHARFRCKILNLGTC